VYLFYRVGDDAEQRSSSEDSTALSVIRVYNDAGNVIEMHEAKGDFKEA